MTYTYISTIYLTGLQSALVLVLCAWVVWQGRPEWALGIYLSTALWARSVDILGIAHTWVLLATAIGAAVVLYLRNGQRLQMPSQDRWIIGWLGIWTGWMLLLIALYRPDHTMPILRSWLLVTLVPLPFILLFGDDTRRIRGFAIAFLATTVVGGWFALSVLNIPLSYLRYDPTLTNLLVMKLNIENYHFIGVCFAIALILAIHLFMTSKSKYARLLIVLASAWCAYFLVLSGSKQSIFFGAATTTLLVAWVSMRRGLRIWQTLLVVSVLIFFGVFLYQLAPSLIVRSQNITLLKALDLSETERTGFWMEGLRIFSRSPLWGEGFLHTYVPHNLFIGTLADQGVIGFVFLAGLFVFLIRQMRGIGHSPLSDERTDWRICFVCLAIFCLLRGQVSSAAYSVWELYWAGAFLWLLRPLPANASARKMRLGAARSTQPAPQESSTST